MNPRRSRCAAEQDETAHSARNAAAPAWNVKGNVNMAEAVLQINLAAVQDNWRSLNSLSGPDVETGAVIKADGYSLGAAEIAACLRDAGARSFFVAQAAEGADVRRSLSDNSRIFVFGGHMKDDSGHLADHRLIPMLNSTEQFARHMSRLPGHPFGLQINTGMNRLGMDEAELSEIMPSALDAGPELILSHLACAEDPKHRMNERQLKAFNDIAGPLDAPKSLAATGGILLGPDYHFDMTRPGIGLYGCFPYSSAKPVVRLDIPVIQTRTVETGGAVGYGAAWTATESRRIATISAGYADGIFRMLGGRAKLCWNHHKCPVVGRISMDLITVDITELPCDPESLQLLGDSQTVDDLASDAFTIGHEVLTNLGGRYKRVYGHSL